MGGTMDTTRYDTAVNTAIQYDTGGLGAGLVPRAGGPPGISSGFYIREAFQSQKKNEWLKNSNYTRHRIEPKNRHVVVVHPVVGASITTN